MSEKRIATKYRRIFFKKRVSVENESMSLRQSVTIYGIDKMALLRYINKKKQAPHVKVDMHPLLIKRIF